MIGPVESQLSQVIFLIFSLRVHPTTMVELAPNPSLRTFPLSTPSSISPLDVCTPFIGSFKDLFRQVSMVSRINQFLYWTRKPVYDKHDVTTSISTSSPLNLLSELNVWVGESHLDRGEFLFRGHSSPDDPGAVERCWPRCRHGRRGRRRQGGENGHNPRRGPSPGNVRHKVSVRGLDD